MELTPKQVDCFYDFIRFGSEARKYIEKLGLIEDFKSNLDPWSLKGLKAIEATEAEHGKEIERLRVKIDGD